MTVKSKRIQTKRLFYNETVDNPPQSLAVGDAAVIWTLQEDITIVGVEMITEIEENGTGWDSGNLLALCDLSRVGRIHHDGVIAACRNIIDCWEATVGINANQVALGNNTNRELVMFPEGYGVDVDDGESLYLNCYAHNEMSNPKRFYYYATIFYTER